jgi:hypothetical protein
MRRVTLLLPLALAACQSAGPTAPTASFDDKHALYTRLTESVKSCWFAGDAQFVGYQYTPEINASQPRILVVSAREPHGRPLLVIEPKASAAADVYGPMLDGPNAGRIRGDLDRWIKGGAGCAA